MLAGAVAAGAAAVVGWAPAVVAGAAAAAVVGFATGAVVGAAAGAVVGPGCDAAGPQAAASKTTLPPSAYFRKSRRLLMNPSSLLYHAWTNLRWRKHTLAPRIAGGS